jgi:ribonuclease PH
MPCIKRSDGRNYNQLRDVRLSYDIYGYAASSVLFELGNTKVLCSVTIAQGVPHFLKGKKTGWLTAEYAMLPSATNTRTTRESSSQQKNGRSVEISRLIGRSLRSVVNCAVLGEQTVFVDCDVLQADGGTRTACITGACLALYIANKRWISAGKISGTFLTDTIAAVSVGMLNEQALLDINFLEDSTIDADFNFVLTKSGAVIEVQGTAEKKPVSWDSFDALRLLAQQGSEQLFGLYDSIDDSVLYGASTSQHSPQTLAMRLQKSL